MIGFDTSVTKTCRTNLFAQAMLVRHQGSLKVSTAHHAWLCMSAVLMPASEAEVLRYTDQQKLALLQSLQFRNNGAKLLAVTTHLHWNPVPQGDKPTLQEVESAELIRHLDRFGSCAPVLLGGDINCSVQNNAYKQLLAAGFQNIDEVVPEFDRKRFTMHVPRAPVPKVTDARRWKDSEVTQCHPCLSDYVLVRGLPIVPGSVHVLDTGTAKFVPDANNGLPNKQWSASDHFPVAYQIEVENKPAIA